jgi:hypothetical protein
MDSNEISYNREDVYKEIEMIQSCITRMAQNSFYVKGWAFTLVTALFALTIDKENGNTIYGIAILIMISFWIHDAYYLKQERIYRFKYEWVIQERLKNNYKYMFNLSPYFKDMWSKDAKGNPRKEPSILSVMVSRPYTLFLFYGFPVVIGIALLAYKMFIELL